MTKEEDNMSKSRNRQENPPSGVTIKGRNMRIEKTKIAGRDIVETKTTTIRADRGTSQQEKELNLALEEINKAILLAPKNKQKSAREKVTAIKQMAVSNANPKKEKSPSGKKDEAQDGILANLVTDLVDMVPGAVAAVVSAFATPLLAGIAGPVTNFAIKQIKKLIVQ